jgi:hypothetical protein
VPKAEEFGETPTATASWRTAKGFFLRRPVLIETVACISRSRNLNNKGRKQHRARRYPDRVALEEMPLDYVLGIMRDTSLDVLIRFDAAKVALPYCHQQLSPGNEPSTPEPSKPYPWDKH